MNRRIVICGSMSHYPVILRCQGCLEERGIQALVPAHEDESVAALSENEFIHFKRVVSRRYLHEIKRPETIGILVVNEAKRGIENYIGANTFAEIVMAFYARKHIFLLHDAYDPYWDELRAWRAIPLRGDLDRLIRNVRTTSAVRATPFPRPRRALPIQSTVRLPEPAY